MTLFHFIRTCCNFQADLVLIKMGRYRPNFSLVFLIHFFLYAGDYFIFFSCPLSLKANLIFFFGSLFLAKDLITLQLLDCGVLEMIDITFCRHLHWMEKYRGTFSFSGQIYISLFIVCRGDWLGKPANIKVENNGDVVYVGSSLATHNSLFFLLINCDWINWCDVSIGQ